MLYASEWEDAESARRMFEDYRKVLQAKSKTADFTTDTANTLAGSNEDGPFAVHLDGTRLTSVEGLPSASRQVN